MPRQRPRSLPAALFAAALACLVAPAAALGDAVSPESGPTPNANAIDTLYWIVFVLGIIILLGVYGALFYCLRRFRARKGAIAAQIRGNTRLEIGWTVGAAAVLVVLAIVTFVTLDTIRNPAPEQGPRVGEADSAPPNLVAQVDRPEVRGRSLEITVNGQQYLWRYTYPDGDENPLNNAFDYETMVVPVGIPIILKLEAQDVIHSWWIPALGGKFDAVPGHTNYTWFRADEPGEWDGQCAELCGRNHANMVATVRAVPPAEWEAYIERRKREIAAANEAAAETRRQLEADDPPTAEGEQAGPSEPGPGDESDPTQAE